MHQPDCHLMKCTAIEHAAYCTCQPMTENKPCCEKCFHDIERGIVFAIFQCEDCPCHQKPEEKKEKHCENCNIPLGMSNPPSFTCWNTCPCHSPKTIEGEKCSDCLGVCVYGLPKERHNTATPAEPKDERIKILDAVAKQNDGIKLVYPSSAEPKECTHPKGGKWSCSNCAPEKEKEECPLPECDGLSEKHKLFHVGKDFARAVSPEKEKEVCRNLGYAHSPDCKEHEVKCLNNLTPPPQKDDWESGVEDILRNRIKFIGENEQLYIGYPQNLIDELNSFISSKRTQWQAEARRGERERIGKEIENMRVEIFKWDGKEGDLERKESRNQTISEILALLKSEQ